MIDASLCRSFLPTSIFSFPFFLLSQSRSTIQSPLLLCLFKIHILLSSAQKLLIAPERSFYQGFEELSSTRTLCKDIHKGISSSCWHFQGGAIETPDEFSQCLRFVLLYIKEAQRGLQIPLTSSVLVHKDCAELTEATDISRLQQSEPLLGRPDHGREEDPTLNPVRIPMQ